MNLTFSFDVGAAHFDLFIMGKRKSRKRKKHSARPPKQKKTGFSGQPPSKGQSKDSVQVEGDPRPSSPEKTEESALAKHEWPGHSRFPPSLPAEVRFPRLNAYCREVRQTLPDDLKSFSIKDLPEAKHRTWIARYYRMRKEGKLDPWKEELLDRIGFSWKRGDKKEALREKLTGKSLEEWEKQFARLQETLRGAKDVMIALIETDEELFDWSVDQLERLAAKEMDDERQSKLRSLFPESIKSLRAAPVKRWRTSFENYLAVSGAGNEGEHPQAVDASSRGKANRWAEQQRKLRKRGELEAWQISLLEGVEFDWRSLTVEERMHARWFANLDRVLAMQAEHGIPIPDDVAQASGLKSWMTRMRKSYADGTLPPDIVRAFEEKGFELDAGAAHRARLERAWNEHYRRLKAYHRELGHAKIPASFAEDPDLGIWLSRQRERMRSGKIKEEKRRALEALGVKPHIERRQRRALAVHLSPWRKMYRRLQKVAEERPDGKLPPELDLDLKIRTWMKRQRKYFEEGRLDSWQVESLRKIGFDPGHIPEIPPHVEHYQQLWRDNVESMRAFYEEHGHGSVPDKPCNSKLIHFIIRTRRRFREGELDEGQIKELEEAGFIFDPSVMPKPSWMDQYAKLCAYHKEHGNSAVPRKYPPDQGLAEFVAQQKQRGRTGKLYAEHIRLLDRLEFPWSRGRPIIRNP